MERNQKINKRAEKRDAAWLGRQNSPYQGMKPPLSLHAASPGPLYPALNDSTN